ncbi:MAG: efflux RND transporter periplasmic adaptor subunit [Pseudomonadota bacterium]
MYRKINPITISLLLGALNLMTTSPSQAQQGNEPPPAPVIVERVKHKQVQRLLNLSGRVYSKHDVELGFAVSGEITSTLEPGTQVAKGELIAELDNRHIKLRRQELAAQAERTNINVDYLRKEAERLERLQETNATAQRLVDEAMNNYRMAQSDARIIQTRIQQVDDELRRSRLVAGFDGVIAERFLEQGEYANPGSPVVRLVDIESLEMRFQVPVKYYARLKANDSLTFALQNEYSSQVTVTHLIPAVNKNSQTFEVRANLNSEAHNHAMTGQLVDVSLTLALPDSELMVPRDALVLRADGSYVYRINQEDRAERVNVTIGEGESDWVVVTGDLKQGDQVAIRGVERLQDGQKIIRSSAARSLLDISGT